MPSILTPYLFWIKLAGFVLALAAAAGAAHYVDANVYGKQISDIKLADANAKTASIGASLSQLQGFIASMHSADADYNATLGILNQRFSGLEKELHDATLKPLPVDCKPDAGRLRVLTDAVAAANANSVVGP